jgi:hypothetical protein
VKSSPHAELDCTLPPIMLPTFFPIPGVASALQHSRQAQLPVPPLPPSERASQASWDSAISPLSLLWARVVRGGVCASVEDELALGHCLPSQTADFTLLYERCMASGLKACVIITHTAGQQFTTVSCSCSLEVPTSTAAATAGRRRHHHRHRHAAVLPPPLRVKTLHVRYLRSSAPQSAETCRR